jgi:hypothetical protein
MAVPVMVAPAAYADVGVLPDPVSIPADEAGLGTATGAEVGELTTGTGQAGLLALAGVGAYQGTCWVLGKLFKKPGGCADGQATILHLLFGGGGDNRTFSTTGGLSASLCGNKTNCAPRVSGLLQSWNQNSAGQYYGLAPMNIPAGGMTSYMKCWDPIAGTMYGWVKSFGNDTPGAVNGYFTTSVPASFDCNSIGLPHSTDLQAAGVEVVEPNQGGTTGSPIPAGAPAPVLRYEVDSGLGTPWTVTYTETCRKGSNTQTASQTITYTPTANGTVPSPTLPACTSVLPGSHIDQVGATGGRGGVTEVTVTQPVFTGPAKSAYPLCTDNAPVGGCWLDLQRNGHSCFDGVTLCAAWTTYESQMTCYWGPYLMAISTCEAEYSHAFDTETQNDPGPSSTATPTASASATTQPTTQALPTSGNNPDPKTGTQTTGTDGPAPDPGDSGGSNCMGQFWSWNPVNWVYVPIKCALKWAFIPDAATLTSLEDQVSGDINGSSVSPWFGAVGPLFTGLGGSAGGCAGPAVTFPMTSTTVHPFDACSSPMSTVASISYAFTSVAVIVLGGLAGLRAVGMGFGFNVGFGQRAKVSET